MPGQFKVSFIVLGLRECHIPRRKEDGMPQLDTFLVTHVGKLASIISTQWKNVACVRSIYKHWYNFQVGKVTLHFNKEWHPRLTWLWFVHFWTTDIHKSMAFSTLFNSVNTCTSASSQLINMDQCEEDYTVPGWMRTRVQRLWTIH